MLDEWMDGLDGRKEYIIDHSRCLLFYTHTHNRRVRRPLPEPNQNLQPKSSGSGGELGNVGKTSTVPTVPTISKRVSFERGKKSRWVTVRYFVVFSLYFSRFASSLVANSFFFFSFRMACSGPEGGRLSQGLSGLVDIAPWAGRVEFFCEIWDGVGGGGGGGRGVGNWGGERWVAGGYGGVHGVVSEGV
ncbi:hypothetical protein L873DRAFT_14762 [Choiromyces venosus 120613-1]|uniref:Uncharacterized protein n=1 Tax=Choiromyces venosus 120613-1 TaxID=1336337 RepID=A0A3N4K647_9PEZI|nr:hypothetical protein L873DRAFT_14762 [Choiromyces venosus 120613-1]